MLRWATAALTGKETVRASLKRLASNKERRAAFGAGAKQFVGDNSDSLKGQDNAGAKDQFKRDKSLPKHMAGIGLGLLAKDNYPIVKAQDIGGGFGSKGAVAREDIALAAAAIDLGRPLKWIEDRSENLLDGGHAREEDMTVSIAVDNDGTLRGLRVDLVFDQGAYPAFPITVAMFGGMMRVMFPGSYRWDAFEIRARAVATNKGRYVAYRGPWANETWARERMLDIVARALGMRPTDLRLKNMMGEDDMAPAMITGPTLDATMSTKKTLERAVELIDIDAFRVEQERARAAGRYLGLGIASYHEAAPGPPNYFSSVAPGSDMLMGEEAWTAIMPDGSVEVYTSQMPHGQSHETTYGQIVADELGVSRHDVKIVYGDTNRTPFGFIGTGGSRGGPMGGGAVKYSSREVRQQLVEQAAKMLEAAPADIEIVDGNIHVAGVPSRGPHGRRRRRVGRVRTRHRAGQRCRGQGPGRRVQRSRSSIAARATAVGRWPPTPASSRSTSRPVSSASRATSWSRTVGRSSTRRSSTVRSAAAWRRGSARSCTRRPAYDDDAQHAGRDVHGLPAADGDGDPRHRDPPPRDDLARWGERLPRRGGGRHDRRPRRRHERDRGRARPVRRPRRHPVQPALAHPRTRRRSSPDADRGVATGRRRPRRRRSGRPGPGCRSSAAPVNASPERGSRSRAAMAAQSTTIDPTIAAAPSPSTNAWRALSTRAAPWSPPIC